MLRALAEHLVIRLGQLRESAQEPFRPAGLAVEGVLRAARGDPPALRRALALARSVPSAGQGKAIGEEVDLAVRTMEAALVPRAAPIVILGPRRPAVEEAISARFDRVAGVDAADAVPPGVVAVAAGVLEEQDDSAVDDLLASVRARGCTLVVVVPVWPMGRDVAFRRPAMRTLRTRRWWVRRIRNLGFELALELRGEEGHACLVLRPLQSPATPSRPRRTTAASGPLVRVNDDLSVPGSFAWISASIALALEDAGVPVTVAPTRISDTFPVERRARLDRLVERGKRPVGVAGEVGWTHYWWRYRRRLGGQHPLALFAINYEFESLSPADRGPWLERLVSESTPLGPISTFCRNVLQSFGVPASRLHLVPMGFTDGIDRAEPRALPGARTLKLLHVTNAVDVARNGTDVAIRAFSDAFAPGDDVTLVVRDYGGCNARLGAEIAELAQAGYDVRYWPAFYSEGELGSILKAFDVLVAPFRGEGFGIKILDAMACGVTPVAPFFGGPRDFLDEAVAFELPFRRIPVRSGYDAEHLDLGQAARWAEVDVASLAATLARLTHTPEDIARRSAAARERALAGFTWRHTALRVAEAVGAGP